MARQPGLQQADGRKDMPGVFCRSNSCGKKYGPGSFARPSFGRQTGTGLQLFESGFAARNTAVGITNYELRITDGTATGFVASRR